MSMNKAWGKTLVISDFDGTIAANDMGHDVITRYAGDGWEEINRAYCAGEIGSRHAYEMIAALFSVSREEITRYVMARVQVDPYFKDFHRFCKEKGFSFIIVSDGLDFYIRAVLETIGLETIPVYSNCAVFHENGNISVRFPHFNEECRRCGNCKLSILRKYREEFDTVVYVGDGHSDVCPSREADFVFAKSILFEKCLENGKECIRYSNFGDIQNHLNNT
ncbi:MAG: MtnX-like HAD-IB family phosphatase [Deltaproteobacteria bacterium]|nr:MtnX-like HAD-IB family phosphatase [Deltaproteobacteria bacterium]